MTAREIRRTPAVTRNGVRGGGGKARVTNGARRTGGGGGGGGVIKCRFTRRYHGIAEITVKDKKINK